MEKREVKILEVNKENSSVNVEFEDGSNCIMEVVQPANIKFAKTGAADITIINNKITYIKSKTINFSSSKPNSFKPANNYKTENNTQKYIIRQHTQKAGIDILKALMEHSDTLINVTKDAFINELLDISHKLEEDIFR